MGRAHRAKVDAQRHVSVPMPVRKPARLSQPHRECRLGSLVALSATRRPIRIGSGRQGRPTTLMQAVALPLSMSMAIEGGETRSMAVYMEVTRGILKILRGGATLAVILMLIMTTRGAVITTLILGVRSMLVGGATSTVIVGAMIGVITNLGHECQDG